MKPAQDELGRDDSNPDCWWLTFPFGTTTVRIHVCLDEPDVTLYNRANVLDPVPGTLFVSFDGSAPEAESDHRQLRIP